MQKCSTTGAAKLKAFGVNQLLVAPITFKYHLNLLCVTLWKDSG